MPETTPELTSFAKFLSSLKSFTLTHKNLLLLSSCALLNIGAITGVSVGAYLADKNLTKGIDQLEQKWDFNNASIEQLESDVRDLQQVEPIKEPIQSSVTNEQILELLKPIFKKLSKKIGKEQEQFKQAVNKLMGEYNEWLDVKMAQFHQPKVSVPVPKVIAPSIPPKKPVPKISYEMEPTAWWAGLF